VACLCDNNAGLWLQDTNTDELACAWNANAGLCLYVAMAASGSGPNALSAVREDDVCKSMMPVQGICTLHVLPGNVAPFAFNGCAILKLQLFNVPQWLSPKGNLCDVSARQHNKNTQKNRNLCSGV